jgi:putative transposase
MPRLRRIKITGEDAYYHIISRTVGRQYYLGEVEKEKLFNLIRLFSKLYLVRVIGYCIMDNHFHLLVKSESADKYSDEEILTRLSEFYNRDSWIYKDKVNYYRQKLSDISEYVKAIKQSFSQWYNRSNNRSGYFWGDRFKSVLVEGGAALQNMLIYIDLNPVRANIVKKPEEYRWSSIGYRVQSGNKGGLLSFDGLYEEDTERQTEEYLKTLYMVGVYKDVDEAEKEEIERQSVITRRLRYLSDGLVIGSKGFIKEIYSRFSEIIRKKRRRHTRRR